MRIMKLQFSQLDVFCTEYDIVTGGRRLYGWEDFAGRKG